MSGLLSLTQLPAQPLPHQLVTVLLVKRCSLALGSWLQVGPIISGNVTGPSFLLPHSCRAAALLLHDKLIPPNCSSAGLSLV